MEDELLSSICKQLNIPQISNPQWICQAIYSVAGKMALASLWDHAEDESIISVQHFKGRAAQIFDAYTSLYPQTVRLFSENREDLIQDIYDIYRRTGHFYHTAYKISPAVVSQCKVGNVVLSRGVSPGSKHFMSGLGFYDIGSNQEHETKSLAEMFDLQTQPMSDYLQELLQGEWASVEWPDRTEYLRLDPPFSSRYWKEQPDADGRISLARYGDPNRIYIFYQYKGGHFWQKPIPEWRVNDFRTHGKTGYGEYRRIALALLNLYNQIPVSTAKLTGSLVEIHLGYRLPPAEEDFFRLYSWPSNFDLSPELTQPFRRLMAAAVYPAFKQQLETIGYHFLEE